MGFRKVRTILADPSKGIEQQSDGVTAIVMPMSRIGVTKCNTVFNIPAKVKEPTSWPLVISPVHKSSWFTFNVSKTIWLVVLDLTAL